MLSKFSVKKPFTVVVGIVIVLILGFVSYSKMTIDLLPSMNMPYALVTTTYAGASPEEVEMSVTEPVEQAMASVGNVKNVSSVSARTPPWSSWNFPRMPTWTLPSSRCGRAWT